MDELRRKEFEILLDVPCLKIFKRKLKFKFKQGIFKDLIEIPKFLSEDWLFTFLNKHGKITKTQFNAILPFRKKQILEYVLDKYSFGMFKGNKELTNNPLLNLNTPPFSSLVCFLTQNTSETLEDLLGYTWEQIQFLIEGAIYNLNEKTKEGQRMNKRNTLRKQTNTNRTREEDLKIAKEFLNKINTKNGR